MIEPGHDAWVTGNEPFMGSRVRVQGSERRARSRVTIRTPMSSAITRRSSQDTSKERHAAADNFRRACRSTGTSPRSTGGTRGTRAKAATRPSRAGSSTRCEDAGAHLMGRVTYEEMATAWPTLDERLRAADERDPQGRLLEDAGARRLGRDADRPRRPGRGDRAAQAEPGKDLIAYGGARFDQALPGWGWSTSTG